MSDNECVPGGGAERVDVNAGAAAGRAHHEPAVGRTAALAAVLEQVVLEVQGHLVVVQQLLPTLVLQGTASEANIQRQSDAPYSSPEHTADGKIAPSLRILNLDGPGV